MTNALALQHNKKEEKIRDMYKTYTIAFESLRGFAFMRYINPRLTLTLTLKGKNLSVHISEQHSQNKILLGCGTNIGRKC